MLTDANAKVSTTVHICKGGPGMVRSSVMGSITFCSNLLVEEQIKNIIYKMSPSSKSVEMTWLLCWDFLLKFVQVSESPVLVPLLWVWMFMHEHQDRVWVCVLCSQAWSSKASDHNQYNETTKSSKKGVSGQTGPFFTLRRMFWASGRVTETAFKDQVSHG